MSKKHQSSAAGIALRLAVVLGAGFYFVTHFNFGSPALKQNSAVSQGEAENGRGARGATNPPTAQPETVEPRSSASAVPDRIPPSAQEQTQYFSYTDSKGVVHLGNTPRNVPAQASPQIPREIPPQVPKQRRLPLPAERPVLVSRAPVAPLQTTPPPNLAAIATNAAANGHTNMNVFESCRCRHGLATKGDRQHEVLTKCEEPVGRQRTHRRGCGEIWLYNFGPNEFMQGVCFEGDRVTKVLSLDYGY